MISCLDDDEKAEADDGYIGEDCLWILDLFCFSRLSLVVVVNRITEVDNLQGIYPLKDEWVFGCSLTTRMVDQMKRSTTKVEMVQRLNELNNQPEIG